MSGMKKVPMRKCVGCQEMKSKKEMIRVIRTQEDEFLLDATGKVIPQTDPVMLRGLWAVFALAPAIGRFMKGVTLLFFNVHGKTRDTMMYELAKIRAAKVVDTGAEEQ